MFTIFCSASVPLKLSIKPRVRACKRHFLFTTNNASFPSLQRCLLCFCYFICFGMFLLFVNLSQFLQVLCTLRSAGLSLHKNFPGTATTWRSVCRYDVRASRGYAKSPTVCITWYEIRVKNRQRNVGVFFCHSLTTFCSICIYIYIILL